jgi:hypothetical protein
MTEQALPYAWPQIGDIVQNHDGGRPPPVDDLRGQAFDWTTDTHERCRLVFDGKGQATWQFADTPPQPVAPEVFAVRPGLYFVDFIAAHDRHCSHSLVLDVRQGRALHIEVHAPAQDVPAGLLERIAQRGSWSAVDVVFRQGRWAEAAPAFTRTTALVGQHYRYRYSDTHVYDHIYLSPRYYSWFCHHGPDAGLGDFEECDYLLIAPGLVLVCWREKLIPCVGVTIEDLDAMRSIGKIFGADAYTHETANRTVGAEMSLVATFSSP